MEKITSLDEMKDIELNILQKVHNFCQEYELKYVLTYGTLLGAIRHNGFIPWDDDIDIWMPRNDYDRFEKIFPEWGEKEHLYIAGPNSTCHYLPRHMLKVCDDRTVLIESKYKDYKTIGIFIDIFPLDNAPENFLKRKIWANYVRSFKYRALAKNIDKHSSAYKNFNLLKKIFTFFASKGDIRKIVKLFVNKAGLYKDETTRFTTAFYVQKPLIFEKEDIFPPQLHVFEKSSFYIPKEYDKILRMTYGDYLKLPPEESRIPLHTSNAYRIK